LHRDVWWHGSSPLNQENNMRKNINMHWDRTRGLFFMAFSWFLLGSMGLATRMAVVYGFTAGPISLARTLTQLLGGIILATLLRQAWFGKNLNGLIFLGIFGGAATLTFTLGLQGTTAARATILNYTFIPISNLIAIILDKDHPSRSFWISLAAGGLGLWIILDPFKTGPIVQGQTTLPGDAWALLSGFCAGAYVYLLKKQRNTESSFGIYLTY
jgi:drug/metabolite transporter (DMT)-like permease